MITEYIGLRYGMTNAREQMSQSVPKPDERYQRNLQEDFIQALKRWFSLVEELKNDDLHPEAVHLLLKFLGQDLQRASL